MTELTALKKITRSIIGKPTLKGIGIKGTGEFGAENLQTRKDYYVRDGKAYEVVSTLPKMKSGKYARKAVSVLTGEFVDASTLTFNPRRSRVA